MGSKQLIGGLYVGNDTEACDRAVNTSEDEPLSDTITEILKARVRRETVITDSPSAAIAAMSIVDGIAWEDSVDLAEKRLPNVDPSPAKLHAAREFVMQYA